MIFYSYKYRSGNAFVKERSKSRYSKLCLQACKEMIVISFNYKYFLRVLNVFHTQCNDDEIFTKLITFEDLEGARISIDSNGKVTDQFVFHFQLLQNEMLISSFRKNYNTTKKINRVCFGLTEKGQMICRALFEKGGEDFLNSLGSHITYPVLLNACSSIDDDIRLL